MPAESQNLYFIALIPSEKIQEDVIAIQRDISFRFESSTALHVVPHITLKAPFKFESSKHTQVAEWFENLSVMIKSFSIELEGFGAFPNPRHPVIYIKPKESQALMNLQEQILQGFSERFPFEPIIGLERSFYPHMTVAYRDLKPEIFPTAWQEFSGKKYDAIFPVNKFYLLKHNGTRWNPILSYDLG